MKSFLIDSAGGYLAWLVLILFISVIVKLIKREKLKSINFRRVFLVALIGIIPSLFGLFNGKSQNESRRQISVEDQTKLKTILQSCFSGEEITYETHKEFYELIDNYKITQDELDNTFSLINSEQYLLLQKSFYEDALITIQTGKISESKNRLDLEKKLLINAQKETNREYLERVLAKEPLTISGEEIILDIEVCYAILNNLENAIKNGRQNFLKLTDRNAW